MEYKNRALMETALKEKEVTKTNNGAKIQAIHKEKIQHIFRTTS